MKTYEVIITSTYGRKVLVEAENETAAREIVDNITENDNLEDYDLLDEKIDIEEFIK